MSMEKINSEELHGKQERIPLSDDELEQISGGINWGPFNDAAVPCYWCKQSIVIYKDRDIYCSHCGGLLRASLYE